MDYAQIYDPLGNLFLSALIAALPLAFLLGSMLLFKLKAPVAAALGLATAIMIAVFVYRMPVGLASLSATYGMAYGLITIAWIILNILFLFRLVDQKGLFVSLQTSLIQVTADQRLQVLLVAYCLGAFFESIAGFGAPVAVTAVILIGLGFPAMTAALLSLIANTTPVIFGTIGTGTIALQGVTGLDLLAISRTAGLQLLPLNLILPIWLVWTFAGFKRMLEIWPAILVTTVSFTLTQTAVAVWHGPWLPTLAAALVSLFSLLLLLRFWKPGSIHAPYTQTSNQSKESSTNRHELYRAWLPWVLLIAMVVIWGIPGVKTFLNGFTYTFPIPGLDGVVLRTVPISDPAQPIPAVLSINWLANIGTGVLISALITGLILGYRSRELVRAYLTTLRQTAASLLTICLLVALGFLTRYTGMDASLGLAFARSGIFYPFFGTLLGWLGVLSTGSITASNVLFGSLQTISAGRLGIDPVVMATANATGGMAGKLISPQSITITAVATNQNGKEHDILRRMFPHSVAMILFIGLIILIQAYLF